MTMQISPTRRRRQSWNQLAMLGLGICTAIALLPLVAVLFYVGRQGLHRLDWQLFYQLPPAAGMGGGGVANALIGTAMVVGLALVLALPLSLMAAIYLSEFSNGRWLGQWARRAANSLSGIPSILIGVFVYGLLVATNVVGFSAIAGGMALAVLMMPILVNTMETALQGVDPDLRWAAASVGASPTQVVLGVVLPTALPGLVTGTLLAVARAMGETAPLLFTALNSSLWPQGWGEPTPTLSVLIYQFATSPFPEQQAIAAAGSLILVLWVFLALAATRMAVLLYQRRG